ncbi:MAG TPA: FG-GAP-like repeat-containing protein, partial [Candidatus Polarisedimenticolia bacterium]|nr:FG-GAP-like repeat-containing protein [Candidatus Polarisedimenticolia bacterium]
DTEQAIAIAESLLNPSPAEKADAPPAPVIRSFLGLAYLRLGEQENCIAHHGIDSCLAPIRGAGVHKLQRGSRAAIKELTQALQDDPDDLSARWLLNIAYMTVGEYPGKVPPPQLIPPKVFDSEYDIKRFFDAAPVLGLATRGHAGGAVMDDFDGDGLLDVMASSVGLRDQLRLYHNDGKGAFKEVTAAAGLTGEIGGLNIVHADYDNDGDLDVFVLRGAWAKRAGRFPNSLLRNNGDGTFEDVTDEAGVLSYHPTQTASWGDYDNDGFVDLFVGNESEPEDPHPCELYHNNRDGTFTNKAVDLGNADLGYVKGVVWGDFNNDGRQDLYVSVLGRENLLFRNDGRRDPPGPAGEDWRFTNVARDAGVVEPRSSFPTWFWDYDNDGFLDIFVGGYAFTDVGEIAKMYLGLPNRCDMPRLYRNRGDGTFEDVTHKVRLDRLALPMGANFGDLDNDGWPDCYFGTGEPRLQVLLPNRMFRNSEGKVFQDVTTAGGFGHLQKGHAIAFGDFDNDGDQDLFEVIGGAFDADVGVNVMFLNPGHGNHWITLRVEGRRSNRAAIGARIRVRASTPQGSRDIYSVVGSGGSFGGNSLQQEIGLGGATAIESIDVLWPATGQKQTFRGAALDRVYRIVEGIPTLAPVAVKSFEP